MSNGFLVRRGSFRHRKIIDEMPFGSFNYFQWAHLSGLILIEHAMARHRCTCGFAWLRVMTGLTSSGRSQQTSLMSSLPETAGVDCCQCQRFNPLKNKFNINIQLVAFGSARSGLRAGGRQVSIRPELFVVTNVCLDNFSCVVCEAPPGRYVSLVTAVLNLLGAGMLFRWGVQREIMRWGFRGED